MKNKLISSTAVILTLAMTCSSILTGCGNTSTSDTAKANNVSKTLNIWTNMEVEADTLQDLANEYGKKTDVLSKSLMNLQMYSNLLRQ